MPSLIAPHDFNRPIDPGGFCYLCGELLSDEPTNTQHVVPKNLFRPEERSQLLMMVAHQRCNSAESVTDEEIGQLVGVLWRSAADAKKHSSRIKKKVGRYQSSDGSAERVAIEGLPIRRIILHWVQGFHAVLYNEYLSKDVIQSIHEPFPGGDEIGKPYPIQPWYRPLVEAINGNATEGDVDCILYPGGNCKYACVWELDDRGRGLCIFALDLYGWSRLGDTVNYPERSCVGAYMHPRPWNAAKATYVPPDSKIILPPQFS